MLKISFFLVVFACQTTARNAGERGEGESMQPPFKLYFWFLERVVNFLLVMILLRVVAARKKVHRLWECFLITDCVVVSLAGAIEVFMVIKKIREED